MKITRERECRTISTDNLCKEVGLVREGSHPDVTEVVFSEFGRVEVHPVIVTDNFGTPKERTFTVLRPSGQILKELTNRLGMLRASSW